MLRRGREKKGVDASRLFGLRESWRKRRKRWRNKRRGHSANEDGKKEVKFQRKWGLSAVLKNYVSESKQKEEKFVRDTHW